MNNHCNTPIHTVEIQGNDSFVIFYSILPRMCVSFGFLLLFAHHLVCVFCVITALLRHDRTVRT